MQLRQCDTVHWKWTGTSRWHWWRMNQIIFFKPKQVTLCRGNTLGMSVLYIWTHICERQGGHCYVFQPIVNTWPVTLLLCLVGNKIWRLAPSQLTKQQNREKLFRNIKFVKFQKYNKQNFKWLFEISFGSLSSTAAAATSGVILVFCLNHHHYYQSSFSPKGLHLFDFSPMCVSKCLLKSLAWIDAKSHWLHLFIFSPLCVFKCVLKWPAWDDA